MVKLIFGGGCLDLQAVTAHFQYVIKNDCSCNLIIWKLHFRYWLYSTSLQPPPHHHTHWFLIRFISNKGKESFGI